MRGENVAKEAMVECQLNQEVPGIRRDDVARFFAEDQLKRVGSSQEIFEVDHDSGREVKRNQLRNVME